MISLRQCIATLDFLDDGDDLDHVERETLFGIRLRAEHLRRECLALLDRYRLRQQKEQNR